MESSIKVIIRGLFAVFSLITFSCTNNKQPTQEKDSKAENHEKLRKMIFCQCLFLSDSIYKDDYSIGAYFERSSYGPEIFPVIDSLIKSRKPNFKSFANHKLHVAECLHLYENDTIKAELKKFDRYLAE